jgi:hypothetical protein
MAALLSPLQIQASAGLLQNQGIQLDPTLATAIDDYINLPLIQVWANTVRASYVQSPAVQSLLQTFAGNVSTSCPALGGSIVDGSEYLVTPTLSQPGMIAGVLNLTVNAYMGNGDLSKFAQNFAAANSYCASTNTFIDTATNSADYLGDTFTGMDNLVSSGLTEINLATAAMGDDLYNAGQYIDLGNLANYGTPLALIQQISRRAGTISPLIAPLINAGVDERIVLGINDPSVAVTDSVQKLMYKALFTVTGDDLASILRILDVWTPNITSLASLLNPALMLPNSYKSLTVPTADGPRAIFVDPFPVTDPGRLTPAESRKLLEDEAAARAVDRPLACELRQSENPVTAAAAPVAPPGNTNTATVTFTVNSNLEARVAADQVGVSYQRLSTMTNPALALANKAYACSLGQVTNISRMTLPQLSAAFLAVETNKDLPLIESQTQAVPDSSLDYYYYSVATGSGADGTILLTDVLGSAVGVNTASPMAACIPIMNYLASQGALTTLSNIYTSIYNNMLNQPLVLSLIASAQAEIRAIVAAYPTETQQLNQAFVSISNQITEESRNLTKGGIDVVNTVGNNQLAIQSFVAALPSYGLDTKVGGAAQYLEDAAADATGQAIVATLREGRTTAGLNAAGVGTAGNAVESTPSIPSPQATLIPSQYSEAQAQARVVY